MRAPSSVSSVSRRSSVQDAVCPEERPVAATGQDPAAQPRPLEVATRYRCGLARVPWGTAPIFCAPTTATCSFSILKPPAQGQLTPSVAGAPGSTRSSEMVCDTR
jgi:hypothetical protein